MKLSHYLKRKISGIFRFIFCFSWFGASKAVRSLHLTHRECCDNLSQRFKKYTNLIKETFKRDRTMKVIPYNQKLQLFINNNIKFQVRQQKKLVYRVNRVFRCRWRLAALHLLTMDANCTLCRGSRSRWQLWRLVSDINGCPPYC